MLKTPLILSLLLMAIAAPALTEEGLAGDWHGEIQLPGMAMGIQVHLIHAEEWSGTIDIPVQGAKGVPLGEIVAENNTISFNMPGIPGDPSFAGVYMEGKIAGHFTQSGQSFEFSIERGAAEDTKRPQDPVPPLP